MRNRLGFILTALFCGVLHFDTCLAAKGDVLESEACYTNALISLCASAQSMGLHPVVSAVIQSKDLLLKEDKALYDSLAQSENEFSEMAKEIRINIAIDHRVRFPRSDMNPIWRFARMASDITSVNIVALPHEIFLGTVTRSAFNLRNYKLILFDQRQWKVATLKEKRLLVLTELLGLGGMDSEDERYVAAVQILGQIQKGLDRKEGEPTKGVYFFNPARREYERYDLDRKARIAKFFISESYPENDYTGYLVFNPANPIFDPRRCRSQLRPDERKTDTRKSIGFLDNFTRGIKLTVDLPMIEVCQGYLLARKDVNLRFLYSDNHLITTCVPEFSR